MEEEEEAPGLRLEILGGPRQGESMEFRPGSAIRIGRVVKGNTLPIKDPGISSKHLSILTESNRWILCDLDSSNGTVLNGSHIPPHTPFTLPNHSTIKIGEVSSIHVTFIPHQPHQQSLPPRRNPSRRTRTEPEPVLPVNNRARGKGRVKIKSVDENDATVVNVESGRVDLPARVTRNSNRVRVFDDAMGEKVKEEPKSTTNPGLVDVSDSSVEVLSVPVVVEEPKKSTRVTRNLKIVRGVSGIVECGVEENVEKKKSKDLTEKRELEKENLNGGDSSVPVVVEEPKKSTRGMRNLKSVRGVSGNVECGAEENVEKKNEKENLNGGDLSVLAVVEEPKKNTRVMRNMKRVRDVNGNDECGVEENVEKKNEKENLNGGDENWPDLRKMTLGEWFDFLEVYLPKQIMDETEEMIDSMRQKAERLRQYIVEMQRHKDMARVEE